MAFVNTFPKNGEMNGFGLIDLYLATTNATPSGLRLPAYSQTGVGLGFLLSTRGLRFSLQGRMVVYE